MAQGGHSHERHRTPRPPHRGSGKGGALVPPRPVHPLFTSSPVCTPLRTPLFKARGGPDCGQGGARPLGDSGTDRVWCAGWGVPAADGDRGGDSGRQEEVGSEPPCAHLDLSPVRAPPCGSPQKNTSAEVVPEEEDEDQSVFFTPELFEEEEEEEEGEKEAEKCPSSGPAPSVAEPALPRMSPPLSPGAVSALSPDLSGWRPVTPPGGQQGGGVAVVAEQATVRDSSGQEVAAQPGRGTNHRTHRLSRSRQKGVPPSAGKLTSYFPSPSQASPSQVILIED